MHSDATSRTTERPGDADAPQTARSRAKADRRDALLHAAGRLFAERGYPGVSLEELGAASGVSGPAVYRHFGSKQAVLAALLVEVSERLLAGGQAVIDEHPDAELALGALVAFHVDFALDDAEVIRVQDRDLTSLADDARHEVRQLQRRYSELWVDVLAALMPDATRAELRVRAQAVFGLINSTPYSLRGVAPASARTMLAEMALAASRATH